MIHQPNYPVAGKGYENNMVAVADSPTGPFMIKKCINYGLNIRSQSGFEANVTHDPQVYKEGNDYYLLYGGYNYKGYIQKLNSQ